MDLEVFVNLILECFHSFIFYLTNYHSFLDLFIIEWLHILSVVLISKSKNSYSDQSLPQRLFAIYIHSFGGYIIIGMCTGNMVACFNHFNLLLAMFLCYSIVFYCPFDLIFKMLTHPFVWPLFELFVDTFAIGSAICEWSNEVSNRSKFLLVTNQVQHTSELSYAGIIFVVAIACEGGDLLTDAFSLHESQWNFKTPAILHETIPYGLFPTFFSTVFFNFYLNCFDSNQNVQALALDFTILVLFILFFNVHIINIQSHVAQSEHKKKHITPVAIKSKHD